MNKCFAVTPENKYCFFGYYDKCPLDEKGEYFLFLQVNFQNRSPKKEDKAYICLCELKNRKISTIGETHAWNFQQGSMLQWLSGKKIIYNIRKNNKFISKIYDLNSRKERIISRPISAVSPNGRYALSINFSRLAKWRPGYGYEGVKDKFENQRWPENDGIYLIDLESGKCSLVLTLSQMLGFRKEKDVKESFGWVNHTLFSPDGKRFIFLNRWKEKTSNTFKSRLFTSGLKGKEIYDLLDSYLISHFDWKNDNEIIVWSIIKKKQGFWIVEDKTGKCELVSKKMQKEDGHCSYSKNKKLLLIDTYPVGNHRYLRIFDTENEKNIFLGKFYSLPQIAGEIRCDLHPRWSRGEKFISFDSTHEGYRRVYMFGTTRKRLNLNSPLLGAWDEYKKYIAV